MKNRPVIVAAALSLVITAALVVRVLVIDKPGVMIILLPPIAGALVALRKPWRRWVIATACALTAVTAVISLIGGVGMLYVPSIALYVWGFVVRRDCPHSHFLHDTSTIGGVADLAGQPRSGREGIEVRTPLS